MRDLNMERDFISSCQRVYREGMLTSTDGNLSCKCRDTILITPTSTRKDLLEIRDIVYLSMDGQVLEGNVPSRESKFHLNIYNSCNDIGAICHAHPIYSTILVEKMNVNQQNILFDAEFRFRNISVIDAIDPGSIALARAIEQVSIEADVIILKNHGIITFGKNIKEACDQMASFERYAKSLIILRS